MNDNYFSDMDPDDNLLNDIYNSDQSSLQSRYFTAEKFNREITMDSSSLSLSNLKIRSYHSNSETFFDFISVLEVQFDIFVFTETRFSGSDGCPIEYYKGCHSGRSGGGVSVLLQWWAIDEKGGALIN